MNPTRNMIYTLALIFIILACNSDEDTPDCIKDKIEIFKTEACDNSGRVDSYEFEGKTVFAFEVGQCGADFFTYILNERCDTLCTLGGIAGLTKCVNGTEFNDNTAKFLETVWKK